jgi:hypothetical protein
MTFPSCRFHAVLRMAATAYAAAFLVSCAREPARTSEADAVVARVNDTAITLGELRSEVASLRGLSPSGPARGTPAEVSRALRLLVERAVVLQEGERLGVAVTGFELEEEVRRYRSDFPPGGLEKSLLQEGLDMDRWRSRLRRSLLYRKSADAIAARRAAVTEEEVHAEYEGRFRDRSRPEQIRVRQLLCGSWEEAAKLRERILAGWSPNDATGRSPAVEQAPAVVDLGFLSRNDLPREIAPELFEIPAGGVSRVIRREKAFSLFQVVEKKEAREVSFEEAGPEIREELLGARREEAFRRWLEESVAAADVRIQESIVAELEEQGR